ncbi:unnamed protein product [Kuraishia capsulata CBS 1993]|uniref:Regulator of rDNA transcription 14 n=1 Tax=Kuraishia capsulata CBS 1993 TaxID=1382522 RepID=W6MJQ8_9ASCO|nr:uncharacterized protein KUCA_T00002194001 [Kuraishia capsulata CBS 1993]CDK26223.1 unnamed protein product [Kuraishia capsulata CBS 1993]
MSFKSSSSKLEAQDTVNKLLSSFLPGSSRSEPSAEARKNRSRASTINDQIIRAQKLHALQEQGRKLKRKEKVAKRARVKRSKEEHLKATRIGQLKFSNDNPKTSKLIKQVIDSGVQSLQSWEEGNASEEEELQARIIRLRSKASGPSNKRKEKREKALDFQTKIKRGVLSYPGLTPGLAPVGATDSEDSEDEREDSGL